MIQLIIRGANFIGPYTVSVFKSVKSYISSVCFSKPIDKIRLY